MKNLVLILVVTAFGSILNATNIISERGAVEVKTYQKQITVKTLCEVNPGGSDRDGGSYEAYCSCGKAHSEIEQIVRAAYPKAKQILYPAPAWISQSMSECGAKPLNVEVSVIYTTP